MAKKNILGLDLGTTSIGFAHVIESENINESEIVQIGVRVNPLTTDEQTDFEKGKPLTTNADRTLKRGARRNLDRYQLRRKELVKILTKANIITSETKLTEVGKNTTFETWRLRAKAVNEKIEKEELARVLLAINKKRGYKSSRKAKNEEEGQAIDGMGIAKKLYEENLTPGQLVFYRLYDGKKSVPGFYRSDLQAEFDKVWDFQKQFYPEIFTDDFYIELQGKGQRATSTMFWTKYEFNTADIKGLENSLKNEKTIKLNKRDQKKLQAYKWRKDGIDRQLTKEQAAYVITEINNNINNSSGYLGAISDRSKELYFTKQTVGQYLYKQLQENPHTRLKNQVFYRQDYMDEFEAIWTEQAKYYPELADKLKEEIRDVVIFYQRKLKSQKGLISYCEFESREIEIEVDGKKKKKTIGPRVAPKSSPLFQEFKIWQGLNNITLKQGPISRKDSPNLALEAKKILFDELNIKGNLAAKAIIEILGYKPKEWKINYTELEGNRTNQSLYNAYLKILEIEGYDEELLKLTNKDDINVANLKTPATEIKDMVRAIFETLGINTEILEFDAELDGQAFEEQASFQLWHLLYSAEDDTQKHTKEDILKYGNSDISLKKNLCKKFGFSPEHAKILANVVFQDDYGSLSTKAMRKIYPFMQEHIFSEACELAGYRYSKNSLTKEELKNRKLKDKLELLKKNSLRNPVVEKILNQMVNVVNTLIDKENDKLEKAGKTRDFYFDEIRVELARELKKNAKERAEMTTGINAAKTRNDKVRKILKAEFGLPNPTRNDIIRYRLYEELKSNGYKDLYTDTYIPRVSLFSKKVDIEHIIPQSKLFDDSFSNKTVVYRQDNLEKGNQTAFDYIEGKYGNTEDYETRIKALFELGKKNKEEGISKAKYQKLLKRESDIGDGFIERDLRDSQYIAKKAKQMLVEITPMVVSTSGSITNRLRDDWGLINVMKELNLPKYRMLGLTEMEERKYGQKVEVIKDWTKRNDHRHHAMDALTVAFTKHSHIQYLNYLNARRNEQHKKHNTISAIQEKETELKADDKGNKKRVFKTPISNFRQEAKKHLEGVIISHKAKNKVVTKNVNKAKNKVTTTIKDKSGNYKTIKGQVVKTPRGQLHKETVYGKYSFYQTKEEKVGSKFDLKTIEKVANPVYKKALLQRLEENGNNPKKAFGGKNALSKNPIYINLAKDHRLPEKVKLVWLEEDYSIRKDITPDNFKNEKSINKILDVGVKRILLNRFQEYGKDAKKAFSDLDKNPIWLNKEKGIAVKRVTISGVNNTEPLHYKKDHLGNLILDKNGKQIPVDYVSTGNNHHVAIYKVPVLDKKGQPKLDENGAPILKLEEKVVSFFEAVERVNQGLSIIDKLYNAHLGWEFQFTMKRNEMFVFPNEETGFNPHEIDLLDPKNKALISPNLFRVQKIATKNYMFRHHLETNVETNKPLRNIAWELIQTPDNLKGIIKVRLNHLGDIVGVGEY